MLRNINGLEQRDTKASMDKFGGVAQLCLTYKCQCNCRHCGVKHLGRSIKKELSLAQLNRIFADLKLCRYDYLDFSGGEPTLRKDIADIIALGKKHSFAMTLETNGLSLTPNLLASLKKAGLGLIYLSMDDYRAEVHDEIRGRQGVFNSAVNVLCAAKKVGLPVHVSMVPKSREYFTKGGANQQIKLCLDNGAEKIRILFPSYVGNCSQGRKIFCSEKDEFRLLEYIDKRYRDLVYIESTMSPLTTVLKEKKVLCPAKSVFSYISCNGYVMPCPYLPFVFGDINKESMIEIVSRMQEHPFMRRDGLYCPTRDKNYLATDLKGVSMNNPFKFAKSLNRINCYSSCNNNCMHCRLPSAKKTTAELLDVVNEVDKKYKSIQLYGGEIFIRDDMLLIIERISADFEVVVHTNARIFTYNSLAQKLRKFNIKAFKVPVFALNERKFDQITGVKGSYQQTFQGIANLAKLGLPVSVYIPREESNKNLQSLISLGIVSISSFEISNSHPLPDSVLCFGNRLKETHLVWLKT